MVVSLIDFNVSDIYNYDEEAQIKAQRQQQQERIRMGVFMSFGKRFVETIFKSINHQYP